MRRKLTNKGSRRLFSATAQKVHKLNNPPYISRGGIRL